MPMLRCKVLCQLHNHVGHAFPALAHMVGVLPPHGRQQVCGGCLSLAVQQLILPRSIWAALPLQRKKQDSSASVSRAILCLTGQQLVQPKGIWAAPALQRDKRYMSV